MNYITFLPDEITNVISSYLDYKNVHTFKKSFFLKINWETLFSYKYLEIYILFKNVFRIDEYLEKYSSNWELFYKDFNDYTYLNMIRLIKDKTKYANIYKSSVAIEDDITRHILYSSLLLHNFPKSYKFKI